MEGFSAGYAYGVLCSDGKLVWNEKHGNYSISLETGNVQFATLFMERLSSLTSKAPKAGVHRRKRGERTIHMNTVTLYGRKEIERFAAEWGLKLGKDWNVPRIAFAESGFRKGFIQGFCDGNGSVSVNIEKGETGSTKKRYVIMYSMNKAGLMNMSRLLLEEGIKTSFYPAGECFALKIAGKTRLEAFRDRVGFGIEVKKKQLEEALLPLSVSRNEESA